MTIASLHPEVNGNPVRAEMVLFIGLLVAQSLGMRVRIPVMTLVSLSKTFDYCFSSPRGKWEPSEGRDGSLHWTLGGSVIRGDGSNSSHDSGVLVQDI